MVIGNVSPLPKPVIVIDVAAIQMFGARGRAEDADGERDERERVDVEHVVPLEQEAGHDAACDETDTGPGPEQSVAEPAAGARATSSRGRSR